MTVKQRENQSINSNSKELYSYQKHLPCMHTSAHVYTHAILLTINSNIAFDLPASIWKICKTKTGQFSFWFSQLRSLTKRPEKSNGNCFLTFILTYIFNYVGCQVLRQTVHVNIFVRSQTAINLFENTCEDILNLSKVAGNKKNLPAIQ